MPHSIERHPIRDQRRPRLRTVVTDPASSRAIYNGELKIIVPAADLQTVLFICRPTSGTVIYACEGGNRRERFEIFPAGVERGTARIPVHHPPTFCLALLALSLAGKSELESLRDIWSGGTDGFLPNVSFIDPAAGPDAATAAVHRCLFDAVAALCGSSATRLLAQQKQYAAFRIVHDQLQNAFDTVESFLSRVQLPPTWLAFACEPSEVTVGPQRSEGVLRTTQLLPLPSQGLAALELHTVAAGPGATGSLIVHIVTCEDDRILGEWAIPYDVVPDGWIFLDLPEIGIAPRQSALLNVAWNTQSGIPPKLSLTNMQPVPESRLRFAGDKESERSLALRLHIGLPGSRRIAHPYQIAVKRQPHVNRLGRRLATSVLRRFTELDAVPGHEPLVRLLAETTAIEVRPVNGSMTVAKLPKGLPAGIRRLTATIKTEDPGGPVVEYALLALDQGIPYQRALTKGQLNGGPSGFSGWLPIHAEFATQIHLTLSEPANKPLDLYLATRLAEGQAAESAQARWLEFIVDPFQEPTAQ
jgi:hypothetical protein